MSIIVSLIILLFSLITTSGFISLASNTLNSIGTISSCQYVFSSGLVIVMIGVMSSYSTSLIVYSEKWLSWNLRTLFAVSNSAPTATHCHCPFISLYKKTSKLFSFSTHPSRYLISTSTGLSNTIPSGSKL